MNPGKGMVVLAVVALLGMGMAQQKRVLRVADVQPENYPTVLGLKNIAETLKRSSGGRIELQVYPAGQLGDERSVIEQVKLGVIDMARVSASPMSQFNAKFGVLSMPFIFRDSVHMWKTLQGPIGRELLDGLQASGFIGLGYYDSGSRNFYTNKKPVRTVADLKDLRIRTQQSQVVLDMMEALGAKPVPMAFGEVYSALQTGAIDGAENNWPSYGPAGVRHYEVAKFFTLSGHSRVPEVIIFSKAVWDKLTPSDRLQIQQATTASIPVQVNAWNALEAQSRDAVLKAGAQVIRVNVREFQQAVQPVYKKYEKDFGDLIDRILKVQ